MEKRLLEERVTDDDETMNEATICGNKEGDEETMVDDSLVEDSEEKLSYKMRRKRKCWIWKLWTR